MPLQTNGIRFAPGASWNDVTGSRALATTYTNSSPYMKIVSTRHTNANAQGASFLINGVETAYNYATLNEFFVLVPPNATYSISAAASPISYWKEYG